MNEHLLQAVAIVGGVWVARKVVMHLYEWILKILGLLLLSCAAHAQETTTAVDQLVAINEKADVALLGLGVIAGLLCMQVLFKRSRFDP